MQESSPRKPYRPKVKRLKTVGRRYDVRFSDSRAPVLRLRSPRLKRPVRTPRSPDDVKVCQGWVTGVSFHHFPRRQVGVLWSCFPQDSIGTPTWTPDTRPSYITVLLYPTLKFKVCLTGFEKVSSRFLILVGRIVHKIINPRDTS